MGDTLYRHQDLVVSSDDECPIAPKPGWKHVWRRDQYGEKYFTEEQIPVNTVQSEYRWVKDHYTGRTYKKQISASKESQFELKTVYDPVTGAASQMLVPKTCSVENREKISQASLSKNQASIPSETSYDKGASYLSSEDKQGKEN